MSDPAETLRRIFDRELAMLDERSKGGMFDLEDAKKLETLTRALRTFVGTPGKPKSDGSELFEGLSPDELADFVRGK